MKKLMRLAAAAALGCAAAPALSAMPGIVAGSAITEGDFMSADVHYRVGAVPGESPGSFSGTYWDIAGLGTYYQVCVERENEDKVAPFYTVTSGISVFGDVRDTQLMALFSNAFPLLDNVAVSYLAANGSMRWNGDLADQWTEIAQYSVALQALTWIIVDNNDADIRPTDITTPFGIVNDGTGDPTTTGYILDWAGYINSGVWKPKDGVTLFYGASSVDSIQDRIWVEASNAVPEPATWAMMIGGFAFVGASMRRRKPVTVTA